ncbi:MAG: hypothetical protein AB7T63_18130 [Planctomycetota bacterium]
MKVLPLLLVQAALVAGGLFLYDQLRGTPAGTPSVDAADLGAGNDATEGGPAAPMAPPLRGAGDVAALTARMALLETKMKSLQDLFTDVVTRVDGTLAAGDGAARGLLDGRDLEAVKEGRFNEPTLTVLRTYLDEVRRREIIEQREGLFRQDLLRAEVDLPADRMQEVVQALVKYQDEALELIRGYEHLGLRGAQADRKPAFEELRARFRERMTEMVGEEQAERIFSARMVKTAGFYRADDDPVKKKDG